MLVNLIYLITLEINQNKLHLGTRNIIKLDQIHARITED